MQNFDTCQTAYDSMTPPEPIDAPEMTGEQICDYCAEQWVIDGGDVELFNGSIEAIANRIEFDDDGETLIDFMAARWRFHGGDVDGWRRCAGEVRSWIVSHLSAYGRL